MDKGTSLTASNAPTKIITPVPATNGVLVFNQRRLAHAASTGVNYPVDYSTNLVHWDAFTPVTLGVTSVPGNPGYEDATLQVPPAIATGKNELFIRGGIAP